MFEFFWLVQYHKCREPYLTWHDPLTRPIVIVSPVVKLREGPDFSFGARWALVQYHAWEDRRQFLDMEDAAAKEFFRRWVDGPGCPWYVRDQYLSENSRRLRAVRSPRKRRPDVASLQTQQRFAALVAHLAELQDYHGAALA